MLLGIGSVGTVAARVSPVGLNGSEPRVRGREWVWRRNAGNPSIAQAIVRGATNSQAIAAGGIASGGIHFSPRCGKSAAGNNEKNKRDTERSDHFSFLSFLIQHIDYVLDLSKERIYTFTTNSFFCQ
ncbi:MAG: hypothetical protein HYS76_00155 [Candidatus Wildermuthbacteria bacterium]|nr:hypothetical protein [Candidatus Wildermuthbacteria bacterium]